VPLDQLSPHTHMSSRYLAPNHNRGVTIFVEASARIDVYAVPPEGMNAYQEGAINFAVYEVSRNRKIHNVIAHPDRGHYWYLLIINDLPEYVNFFFDVRW
jgi:hypothetical protein